MTQYRYSADSLVDLVDLVKNERGGLRAYVHARDGASPERLAVLQERCASLGWTTVPTTNNGQPVLELRGFKTPRQLLNLLSEGQFTHGAPQLMSADKKSSLQEQLGNATLKAAGVSYIFGDAAFLRYTLLALKHAKMNGSKQGIQAAVIDILAGIGYALGTLTLFFYGSKDQSKAEIREANQKIHAFVNKENLATPDDSALKNSLREERKGFFGKANDFLSRYPSEVLNTLYTGVGLALLTASAINYRNLPKGVERRNQLLEMGLGVMTAISSLTGLLVKEKKPIEGEKKQKHTGLGAVWDWIQEKPLRATGYGLMVSTGFHAIASWRKYRSGDPLARQQAPWRAGFVGFNVVSEVLIAISSKGHGDGVRSRDIDNSVISSTAEYIAKQDPAKQDALIERLAGFMSAPELFNRKAEMIATELRVQVDTMGKNPWVRGAKPRATAAPDITTATPVLSPTPEKPGTEVKGVKVQGAEKEPGPTDKKWQTLAAQESAPHGKGHP